MYSPSISMSAFVGSDVISTVASLRGASVSPLPSTPLGTVTEQVIQFTDTCGKIL